MPRSKYKRIMLKLSGEVLLGKKEKGIDFEILQGLAAEIVKLSKDGVQVVVVIGGGNIWRYRDAVDSKIARVSSDNIGMLATIMNGLALQSAIENEGVHARVCSAIEVPKVAEPYLQRRAIRHLEKGRVVICAGGTGNPFFTTDSAAALRGLELSCEVLLKATKVDGIYDKDPEKEKDAKKFDKLTFSQVLEMNLRFMDASAVSLCRDGDLPIIVFSLKDFENIGRVASGEILGTVVLGK